MDEQQRLIEQVIPRIREVLDADSRTSGAAANITDAQLEPLARQLIGTGQI